MIIIDEGADRQLVRTLKDYTDIGMGYCLHLYPVSGNAEQVRTQVVACAQNFLPGANIYMCDDGEIFLLTKLASLKECKKTMLALSDALAIQPVERLGGLYDMSAQAAAMIAMLEKKIENRRIAEEALENRQKEERAATYIARKRRGILEQSTRHGAEEIAALRAARGEPVIMIIEDDPFSRRLVENVLQKQFRLVALESAEDALTTYADMAPDLLFLDINLPDVSGHELLEKIIALDPESYVIMLSGNADKDNIMQAMGRGAKGFVAKPFSRDKLFQYIDRCPTITRENV